LLNKEDLNILEEIYKNELSYGKTHPDFYQKLI